MFRDVLVRRDGLKEIAGLVVVLVRAFDEGQGQAIAGGRGFLVLAEAGEELAELGVREGVLLLVVGFAGAGEQHVGHLLGGELGVGRVGAEQPKEEKSGRERTAKHPGA